MVLIVLRSSKRFASKNQCVAFASALHVQASTNDSFPCVTRECPLSCISAADLEPLA